MLNSAAQSNINFIPEDIVRTRRSESTISSGNKLFIVVTILIALASGGILYYNQKQTQEIQAIKTQIENNKSEIESLKEFGKNGFKLGVRLQNAKNILNERYYYSDLFTEMLSRKPDNIDIKTWSVNDKGVFTFVGDAYPNYTPIADFRENLLRSDEDQKPIFTDAKLISSNYDKSKGLIEFVMEIKLAEDIINGQSR